MAEPGIAEPGVAPPGTTAGRSWWRWELWAFLELFALCGFVVVQPLLDIIGTSPDFLIFHGVTTVDALVLVLGVGLVPPVAVWAVGALVGLIGPRVRRVGHLASVGLLCGLLGIQLGKHFTGLRGIPLASLAVLLAGLVVVGYRRWEAPRMLLRFAAVGPAVFALMFTFASPSAGVIAGGGEGAGSRPATETGPHPPIVLIVFDEFPLVSLLDEAAEIDPERFPHFAALAADATWYRNATAVAGWTPYALPAMLTGRYPAEHVAPHYALYPDNLFTLLDDAYQITASESITQLCPPWECGELADRARGGLPVALRETATLFGELVSPNDPVSDPYADFAEPTLAEQRGVAAAGPEFRFSRAGENQPARFHEFATALASQPDPAGGPTLRFLHLLLPHTPWSYLPSGMRYHGVPGLPVDGQWWGRLASQRHELQLRYTDRLLGELIRVLKESGRYDESLVVVTADHGVSLTPGATGREVELPSAATELAWVPLFIKEPGQTTGEIDDRNWQQVDLLPTLADYAGFEVPWRVDGIAATKARRTETDKIFFNQLDDRLELDGPAHLARLLANSEFIPPVPPAPLPELIGTPADELPIVPGGGSVEVDHLERFAAVDPASGFVPALVDSRLAVEVPEGTPVAIAVNGRIGAVVPVVVGAEGERRVTGLVADDTLFRPGRNELALFLRDGAGWQRLDVR